MAEWKLCSWESGFVPCIFPRCTEDVISKLCAFPIKAEHNDLPLSSFYSFFIALQYNMCMVLYRGTVINYDVGNISCVG